MAVSVLPPSGRVPAIATGLVETDDDGGTVDRLARLGGAVLLPGQRLRVQADDPAVMELVQADRLTIVGRLPTPMWWEAEGRILQTEPGDARVQALGPSPSALKIVQGTGFDPGAAAFRTHTAINEASPHCSAFVRQLTEVNNPHDCPTQYDLRRDVAMVRSLLLDADVVHCHVDPLLTRNVGFAARPRPGQIIVRHYHGTQFGTGMTPIPDERQAPRLNAEQDDRDGYVLVGARLQVCALRPGRIQWLPIPVPVVRYAAMSKGRTRGPVFRIAHSPTRRRLKGSDTFLGAIKRLKAKGLPVEAVLIENLSHADALRLKSSCDATFDSFALGIQGSGLEAAAMGQPVIAGDAYVRELYQQEVGYVPYLFADNASQLEAAIERLMADGVFYADEQRKVGSYCLTYHDYAAVAKRYDTLLREAA